VQSASENTVDLTLDVRSYAGSGSRHTHDYHQLVLPLEGCLEMVLESESGSVEADHAAVISANIPHHFRATGNNRFIVADVPRVLAPSLSQLPTFIRLDPALAHFLLFLRAELGETGRNQQNVNSHKGRQLILLLVQLLTERFGCSLHADRRLEAARQYLDDHMDRSVTLAELATVASMSQRQLTELFRRYFDMSPRQYLLEQRMQQGWRLLHDSRLPIQQVSERCGYGSLSAFSARFSNHFGYSPRTLRQDTASPDK
jgi:AraC-like DNA-binding protein